MKRFCAIISLFAAFSLFAGMDSNLESTAGQIGPGSIVWSEDGAYLALGSWSGEGLWAYDLDKGKLREIDIEGIRGRFIGLSDGFFLAKTITDNGQRAVAISVASGGEVWSSRSGDNVGAPVAIDGGFCYSNDGVLVELDGDFNPVSTAYLPGLPQRLVVEARDIYYSSDEGIIRRYNLDTKTLDEFPCENSLWNLRILGDSIAAEGSDGNIWLHSNGWRIIAPGTDPVLFEGGIIFTQTECSGKQILSSRIMLSVGGEPRALTPTNILAGRPSISPDGKRLCFVNLSTGDAYLANLVKSNLSDIRKLFSGTEVSRDNPRNRPSEPMVNLDCPYIHQVYDTPDWFNGGWSCGPTSCMMAQKKYGILPNHDITCSWPYSHTSSHGWYIPTEYTFNGYTYDIIGLAADDVWVPGAHGFICREVGGAIWTCMRDWLIQHYFTSTIDYSPTWAEFIAEIDAGYVVVASTNTIGYGHIMIFKGYLTDHTIICNDPYGNANTSPWRDYYGADVYYDWPGYDNGHVVLGVSGLIFAHGPAGTATPDTIVDDRSTGYRSYGSTTFWHEAAIGWESHMWWTYSTNATDTVNDTCYVTWTPILPGRRLYEVFTYIPSNNAVASANYRIYHDFGISTCIVRQQLYSDQWISLGTYSFEIGEGGKVYLGDGTGYSGEKIGFDAIKWSDRGPLAAPDTLVPLASDGFRWGGPIQWRRIVDGGTGGKFYWTGSITTADVNSGTWRPNLPADGDYEVLVYIPSTSATANAVYRVRHLSGETRVTVNQSSYSNEWVSLGAFRFSGSGTSLYLGDSTGTSGARLAFDSAVWRSVPVYAGEISLPNETALRLVPNPFNSACRIEGADSVDIYSVRGDFITKLFSDGGGIIWNGRDSRGGEVPNGVYLFKKANSDKCVRGIYLK